MSVASKNPFALLDDGADASPAPAAAAPAPPAPAAPARDKKPQTQKGPRGGQYYSRGGARNSGSHADANPNQNGIDQAESAPRKFEGGRGRGRGRGGDARGAGRGGRRPFDKHSATGRTDSVKKVHQGWGGDDGDTELQAEAAATVDAAAEQQSGDAWGAPAGGDAAGWGTEAATTDAAAWDAPAGAESTDAAPTTEDKPAERRPRREEEEEDNTLTLDQYLAQKKEKEAAALPEKPQGRQANEGAEGDLFKDAVPIQKGGEEDAYFVGKGKSAPKARTKKEEKVYLEIDARFERPSRGGRGRGDGRGRGEGRGGGGGGGRGAARGDRRGGPRGGGARQNNGAPTVNVNDETAFPSLS